ncbi:MULTISPECIES: type I 3-dehydroquinate dehydratase [unclassified Staphylococcus]|uniref:type I 3-dehydroquinate dehydratase n=1 Tax=unclassified Staphylococcus TaxID=91994 RepID=UPI0021D355ED|nr:MULTISPECIES: type I 3-dehydroquinate dehydratase [unclassified Staphylococcus]UXR78795.1 type I 3-dehydroquinate dehydratase [Staphylococcus sp. IVB6227]UXR82955.1 type I 3-dehydroquinate dehydratase [Staphylococcus sp. IVB6214]
MKSQIVASLMPKSQCLTAQDLEMVDENMMYFHILELRIDAMPNCDIEAVRQMITALKNIGGSFQILVTYRTKSQGGAGSLDERAYQQLLIDLSEISQIDWIDVEWTPEVNRTEACRKILSHGAMIVASYHNFHETPSVDVMKKTYFHLSQMGASHLKIAVMPQSREDVLRVLQAVAEASDALTQWVTGIAMSHLGLITRTAQSTFGGCLSFGALEEAVAPGQISVKQLFEAVKLYD